MKTDKEEIKNTLIEFEAYLDLLCEAIDNEYVDNKEYWREKRLHKWKQNLKDLKILKRRVKLMRHRTLSMIDEAPMCIGRKIPKSMKVEQ